jgi:coenzyme Q-binding protein COQ10
MPNTYNYKEYIAKDSEEVFALISDFTDYKNFLPGCIKSESISSTEDFEIGELEFNLFNKQYFIESKNYKTPTELKIKQMKGPFNNLEASWQVIKKDKGCLVSFYVEFDVPFLLRPFMRQALIDSFATKYINAFIQRAE